MPHAGQFLSQTDEQNYKLEEMIGRSVEISIAMNGQQFVNTGLSIKYDKENKPVKKSQPAEKKKK